MFPMTSRKIKISVEATDASEISVTRTKER
jgi:hypothetical protein